jgi:two-component system, chemotaxis family, chemotaxis protein CheY
VRPTVLLVEDELTCSQTLEVALESAPEPDAAPSLAHTPTAEQALAILREHAISLLITDINLPSMDGLELIRRVRAEPRWANLPIIVTSADGDPATHERALRLGANAFFTKPYSPLAIRHKIEELIGDT